MFRLICLAIGYCFGCFQTAYIVGKVVGKIDIREHGSGNAGMTNAMRVLGAKPGIVVFAVDVLKGVCAYCLCSLLFQGTGIFMAGDGNLLHLPGLYAGIGAILGHNFPFFLKFKGGKGIAASIGVILSFNAWVALVTFCVGLACVFTTKYISLSALLGALVFPFAILFFGFGPETVALGFGISILAIYQHRANIGRLRKGTESKFSIKKKEKK